jgi:hypothetical protein
MTSWGHPPSVPTLKSPSPLPLNHLPYRHDSEQDGKLVPCSEWAPVIKEHFFDACERLQSAGAVQRHLLQLGILVPKRQSKDGRTRGGKSFSKQQVIRVLSSEVYLGTLRWGDAFPRRTR